MAQGWIEFLQKVVISLAIGAMVGLEREYTKRSIIVGVRTFSLISLFGALSVLLSQALGSEFLYISFFGMSTFALFYYYLKATKIGQYGLTTVFAMLLTYVFGALIALNLIFEAVSASIIVTMILVSRERLHAFVSKLTYEEIIDALEFAVAAFIILPLIPDEPIVLFGIPIPLKAFWLLVIFISLISFASFIAIRFFGAEKGVLFTSFFGGLVNSNATVGALARQSLYATDMAPFISGFLLANTGSMLRNLAIIFVTSTVVGLKLAPTFLFLAILSVFLALKKIREVERFEIGLKQPFAIWPAMKFASIFLIMLLLIDLVKKFFGDVGVLFISLIAGLAESGAVSASVALMLASRTIDPNTAALSVLLANLSGFPGDLLPSLVVGARNFVKASFLWAFAFYFLGLTLFFLVGAIL